MTKAKEILSKYPSVKIGFDEHYGKQTTLRMINEALSINTVIQEQEMKNKKYWTIKDQEEAMFYKKLLKEFGEEIHGNFYIGGESVLCFTDKTWVCEFYDFVSERTQSTLPELMEILLSKPKKVAVKVDRLEAKELAKYLGIEYDLGDFENEVAMYLKDSYPELKLGGGNWDYVPNVKQGYQIKSFADFAKENGLKVPLIVSEDGVTLYEGDKAYWCIKPKKSAQWEYLYLCNIDKDNSKLDLINIFKLFSTEQAAKDWVAKMNKPKDIEVRLIDSTVTALVKKDTVNFYLRKSVSEVQFLTSKQLAQIQQAMDELNK